MKRLSNILLTLAILVSGIFLFGNAHAQPIGSITLTTNTEWTASQSPINLNGTVTVNGNVTLTIDPGVSVNLGSYMIYVQGTLKAQGTPNNQITFMGYGNQSIQPPPSVPIMFAQSSAPWNPATNTGSIIQNAVLTSVSIDLYGGSPEIDSCIFNFATPYASPINIQTGSSAIISNNVINYNVQNFGGITGVNTIYVSGGNPTIANNQFEGSFGSSSNVGITIYSGSPIITGNTFGAQYGNNSFGIKVNSGNPQISGNQFNGEGWLTGVDDLSDSAFTVSNNVFSDCFSGVKAESGSTLTVQGNQFLKGTDGIDIFSTAPVAVIGNLIDGNSQYGINGGGAITSNTISNNQIGIHNPPTGVISDNNIVGNTLNSITTTVEDVDAQNNWWGTTDAATINQTIYDTRIDPHLGTVLFVPFLTQPSLSAPAIPASTPTITPIPTQLFTPSPTPEPVITTPTTTPIQYSKSFAYQVGTMFNLNMITITTAIILVLVWVVMILGYATKRALRK